MDEQNLILSSLNTGDVSADNGVDDWRVDLQTLGARELAEASKRGIGKMLREKRSEVLVGS